MSWQTAYKTTALQQKLCRELWHMRSQALAIILVIVGGVGVCVMSLSTYHSLLEMRDSYYLNYRFADVFVSLKRAPLSLVQRIEQVPGVAVVEPRVVAQVNLEVAGFGDPITGLLNTISDQGQSRLNQLHLLAGRFPDSRRDNEVLISDAFAEAQRLELEDKLTAIINGRRRELQVVGIALSPDYIYQIAPGAVFPDYKRFGVLWMARAPLSIAYNMEGAFNDLSIALEAGASEKAVIERLDLLLDHYGSLGAYGRDEQFSNLFLKEEFAQLQTMTYLFPAIFLGVAVFLLNVVLSRLVNTQREIIAVLKAFGYSNLQVAWHYVQLVLAIVILGIACGFVLGVYLGQLMTETYTQYYRFPEMIYAPGASIFIWVALITIGFALIGILRSVKSAVALPPAEAMRPEPPEQYRLSWLERLGMQRYLSQASRMILRHLQRKPGKSLFSILGLAMASAIMMVGNFQQDAVAYMMHVQFSLAQKQDVEVTLYEPVAKSTLNSFLAVPGVYYAEGLRTVPVRLYYQHRSFRTSLQGLPDDSALQQVLDTQLKAIRLPENGLMVTAHLARKLGFHEGDEIEIEVLEGHRRRVTVVVTQLSQQYLGLGTYMRIDNLNRLMSEGPAINQVLLKLDDQYRQQAYSRLKAMPAIAGVNLRQTVIESFQNTMEQILLVFTAINALLGGVIAFGVVYNTTRIALAERGRELASMRVLGYTQGEIAYILLGELALLTLLSLPLGLLIGTGLCQFMADNMASDLFRIPLVLTPFTYSFSVLVVLLSAIVSAVIVWLRLSRINLIEVLKTRE